MPNGKKSFTNLKDKKIRIIGVDREKTKSGMPDDAYFDLCGLVWANFRSVTGEQYFIARATDYELSAIFTINWRNDVREGMYILYNGNPYLITYVDKLEGYKKELKLHCETSTFIKITKFNEMNDSIGVKEDDIATRQLATCK